MPTDQAAHSSRRLMRRGADQRPRNCRSAHARTACGSRSVFRPLGPRHHHEDHVLSRLLCREADKVYCHRAHVGGRAAQEKKRWRNREGVVRSGKCAEWKSARLGVGVPQDEGIVREDRWKKSTKMVFTSGNYACAGRGHRHGLRCQRRSKRQERAGEGTLPDRERENACGQSQPRAALRSKSTRIEGRYRKLTPPWTLGLLCGPLETCFSQPICRNQQGSVGGVAAQRPSDLDLLGSMTMPNGAPPP